jgi:hypothetical protein
MEIRSKDIVITPIKKLVLNPKNNNKHPKEQIERLAQLIEFQGFRNPVVVSNRTGFVVAGHGRIEAAKKLGIKDVPVMFQDFDNEAQEYAYLTSDNAIALWAELDLSYVNAEMIDLGPDFDIDLLGIKDFSIEPAEKYESKNEENGKGALDKLEKYLDKDFLEVKLEYNKKEYDDFIFLASEVMKEMNTEILSDALLAYLKQCKEL